MFLLTGNITEIVAEDLSVAYHIKKFMENASSEFALLNNNSFTNILSILNELHMRSGKKCSN